MSQDKTKWLMDIRLQKPQEIQHLRYRGILTQYSNSMDHDFDIDVRRLEDPFGRRRNPVLTLCMRKTELPLIVIVAFVLLSCVLIGVLIGVLISVPIGYYSAPKSSPCPDDWMLVSGRCYYFSERETDWKSSEKFCTDAGGSLVMLKDNKTEEVVNRLKNKYDYWIGLKKDAQGKWKWSDGTLYTGKIAPEEDGSQLDCAYLDSRIGVLHCSSQRRWICTKDPH
ncbi:C-type lectin domain family 2 member B-like isoform X2 [Ascaphus truei]